MVTKQQKQEVLAVLTEKLKDTKGLYLVDYKGMTAAESVALRREFRSVGGELKIAKNTLIRRALKEVGGFDIPDEQIVGQTAIAFGYKDAIAPSKIIKRVADKDKKLTLKAAVIEGQVFGGDQLDTISNLPSREDLIAGILGSLQSPISGIVGSINALMRDVASLVEEVAKNKAA